MIRSMLRWLTILLVLLALCAGGVYYAAGKGAPPSLTVEKPERAVGQTGTLEVVAAAPGGVFTSLSIALEQNGREQTLFTLSDQQSATVTKDDENRLRISKPFGKKAMSELRQGPARIIVRAA